MQYSVVGDLRYKYEQNVSSVLSPCPGFYCGRVKLEDGNWSECQGCPRGYKKWSFDSFDCVPCDKELSFYDWLFLGFMALLPIILHFASMDRKLLKQRKSTMGLIFCSFFEVFAAASITLLLWEPVGSFNLKSCGVVYLADWYPIFYNPRPNYEETLYCAHEVVYPLFTIILVFLAIADVLMILLRIIAYFFGIKVAKSLYAGLYFYPVLALAHVVLGGVIYYIFPYLTIIASVVSCAFHFSKRTNQSFKDLVVESMDWRNAGIILGHWILHAYGIISLTQLAILPRDLCLLVFVPVPSLLYIFTSSFTDPDEINAD